MLGASFGAFANSQPRHAARNLAKLISAGRWLGDRRVERVALRDRRGIAHDAISACYLRVRRRLRVRECGRADDEPFSGRVGAASAIFGVNQFLTGALVAALLSTSDEPTPVPLAASLAFAGAAGAALWWGWLRHRAPAID